MHWVAGQRGVKSLAVMIRLAACLLLPLVAGSNLSCSPVDQWEPVCFLGASIERSPPQTYANWHAMWCEQGAASHGQWSIGECVSDAAAAPAGATATDEEDSSLQRRVLHDDTDDDHGEEDDHEEDDGGEHEADDKHSGDAGGHSAEGHDEAHGSHQYALLYFAFLAIVMGCATECVLNRHFPKVRRSGRWWGAISRRETERERASIARRGSVRSDLPSRAARLDGAQPPPRSPRHRGARATERPACAAAANRETVIP